LLGFAWPICATVEEKEHRKIPAARVYRCRYITRNKHTKETRLTDEAKGGKENSTTDQTAETLLPLLLGIDFTCFVLLTLVFLSIHNKY
jgi:hypothetical protein